MRFLTLVRSAEAQGPPPTSYVDAADKKRREAIQAGIVVTTGGLAPSAHGVRLRVAKGKLVVTDGPFTEAKEVIGGYAVLELPSREEAIQAARDFMQFHATTGRAGRAKWRCARWSRPRGAHEKGGRRPVRLPGRRGRISQPLAVRPLR